jgi:hypothetical protein
MIRALLGLPFLIAIVAAAWIYGSYGEIEPCRVLAVERARQAEHASGLPVEGAAEHWTRIETSQMSSGACAKDLIAGWWDQRRQR